MRPVTLGQLDSPLEGLRERTFWDPEKPNSVLREDSSKT